MLWFLKTFQHLTLSYSFLNVPHILDIGKLVCNNMKNNKKKTLLSRMLPVLWQCLILHCFGFEPAVGSASSLLLKPSTEPAEREWSTSTAGRLYPVLLCNPQCQSSCTMAIKSWLFCPFCSVCISVNIDRRSVVVSPIWWCWGQNKTRMTSSVQLLLQESFKVNINAYYLEEGGILPLGCTCQATKCKYLCLVGEWWLNEAGMDGWIGYLSTEMRPLIKFVEVRKKLVNVLHQIVHAHISLDLGQEKPILTERMRFRIQLAETSVLC